MINLVFLEPPPHPTPIPPSYIKEVTWVFEVFPRRWGIQIFPIKKEGLVKREVVLKMGYDLFSY